MSTTARDLISASLRKLGAVASGEALSADEATDGLGTLNALIDSWSTESLLIPNKVREVFTLVAGQQTYTMGTGGDFNTSRPQLIENAEVQVPGGVTPVEIPIQILNKDQFAEIVQKATQGTYPQALYADYAYPLCNVSFWMVPAQTVNVALYSWKPLSRLTDLSTALSLPPGYERALIYALAIDLAPEYGRAASAEVVGIAAESKAAIKRMNSRSPYLRVDDALLPRRAGFNIFTGGYGR